MNSAPMHYSRLTWSNSAVGTKKKKKHDFQNVDAQMPNPNRHFIIKILCYNILIKVYFKILSMNFAYYLKKKYY